MSAAFIGGHKHPNPSKAPSRPRTEVVTHLKDARLSVHVNANEALPNGIRSWLSSLLQRGLDWRVPEWDGAEQALHVLRCQLASEVAKNAVIGPSDTFTANERLQQTTAIVPYACWLFSLPDHLLIVGAVIWIINALLRPDKAPRR
jgi:hypothetical protein